jgi:uncharacterized protein
VPRPRHAARAANHVNDGYPPQWRTARERACATRARRWGNRRRLPHNVVPMRTLRIKVKPGSREDALVEQGDGTWLARVKAPPVDGKANAALIALVAAHFGLRKAQVSIRSGASGRTKLVQLGE